MHIPHTQYTYTRNTHHIKITPVKQTSKSKNKQISSFHDLILFSLPTDVFNETYSKSRGTILVGKPEGKRPLGRPRRRWINNIKIDLLQLVLSVVDWIGLVQDRYRRRALVNEVMNLRVP
jgi:hypothetical protein